MNSPVMAATTLTHDLQQLALRSAFSISGYVFTAVDAVTVTLSRDGMTGRGEAEGVYYHDDTADLMLRQIEAARELVEGGGDRTALLSALPPGGARNALDCAMWELESMRAQVPVWKLAGGEPPRPLRTTYTIGAGEPGHMAAQAREWREARAIKLKLMGTDADAERVRAVRAARPDAWLMVDANQGFTPDTLHALMPVLVDASVRLIEQPFPVDRDGWMGGLQSPIRIAADESFQDHRDFDRIAGRYAVVNIKLDKCGGLTEALTIVREAKRRGVGLMVGNMGGTSLAMAPAFIVGQSCEVVDLDGPLQLAHDPEPRVRYEHGDVYCPDAVWGAAGSVREASAR